jgi:hypothetical protein
MSFRSPPNPTSTPSSQSSALKRCSNHLTRFWRLSAYDALDKLAAVRAAPYDPVRSLYRALLLFDVVAVLILAVGLGEFLYFEPPGQSTGLKATIVGVYQYDPTIRTTSGPDRRIFSRTEQLAAVVDWSSLPQGITVDARWYDGFEAMVGRVGPGTPAQLAAQTIVPVGVPAGMKYNLPGQYVFVVERLQGGVPVEVLARRIVKVERE